MSPLRSSQTDSCHPGNILRHVGSWCPGASQHQGLSVKPAHPLQIFVYHRGFILGCVTRPARASPRSPPALRVQAQITARRGCVTPSENWTGTPALGQALQSIQRNLQWTHPNSAGGCPEKPLQGQEQMGELQTPTQPAICPDSRPSAGQPLLPTHHLPPCQALLLAPWGLGGNRAEDRIWPGCLGPPYLAPPRDRAGRGSSQGVMSLHGS